MVDEKFSFNPISGELYRKFPFSHNLIFTSLPQKIISDSIESDHVENCISSSDPVFIRKVIADRTMCAPKFALIFGPLSPACVPSGVPTLIIGTNKAIYSTEQRETICDRERSSSLVNVSGFLLSDSCANLKIELISNWFDPSLDVSKTISNLKFPKYVLIRLDQADGITHNPKLQSFLAHLSDVNCKVSLVCSPFCIHRTSSMSDKSFVYGTQPVVIFSGPKMITVQRSFTDMESDFLMEVKMFKSSLNFDPDLNDQSSQTLGFVFGTSLSEFCMERIKQVFPRVVFIGALYNMNRTIVSNYFDDDQRSSYIQPITLKSFSERVKTTLMRGSPPKDGFTITLMNIASNSR